MTRYQLIAGILWSGFQVSLIALIAGLIAQVRRRRMLALTFLLISVVGILAFSLAGGFSVGRFTAIIPVLTIGYAVGMGRGATAVAACLLGAVAIYIAFSWLLTPHVPEGGVVSFVLGSWAIPLYAILGAVGFFGALARPPRAPSDLPAILPRTRGGRIVETSRPV